ncbi:MAG: NADPH-dependent oxidoreductase [Hydrogenophaga sp.]|jgi:nitroreductase|uniref:NADPH-dependent oxidoreductase n=1 Tax=Hydrogenophaga sp. TaxID=1904254 RepID=UPI002A36F836|nr:NADPH-dependent oxidoreductase [Hydrogenophaga sp.]MDX9969708.1 NADPH-dependent oxidoreductase [Hydrogenophaga sp.]
MTHTTTDDLHQRYAGHAPAWTPHLEHPVLQSLLRHRSVRRFLSTPLAPGVLDALVAAAQSAPTSSNLQTWSVVVVQEQALRDSLAALAGHQAHIAQAPVLLVWVADLSRALRLAEAAGQAIEAHQYLDTYLMASVDAGLAAQNVVAAAEALGHGTVYIGALRNHAREVTRLLALPRGAMPVFGLVVGLPDPAAATAIKPRLAPAQVVHFDRYRVPDDEQEQIADYDVALRAFQRANGLPEVGWTPAVLQRLKNGQSLNGREHLREAVQAAGFELR